MLKEEGLKLINYYEFEKKVSWLFVYFEKKKNCMMIGIGSF